MGTWSRERLRPSWRVLAMLLAGGLAVQSTAGAVTRNHRALTSQRCLDGLIAAPFGDLQVDAGCPAAGAAASAIAASMSGHTGMAVNALARARREQSTFTRSLSGFALAELSLVRTPWARAPYGLAEYYASLAREFLDTGQSRVALRYFQRALANRPVGWEASFYHEYASAVARDSVNSVAALRNEQTLSPGSVPTIGIGRKDRVGWDAASPIDARWRLEGFTLRHRHAFELGLPFTVDFFWLDSSNGRWRQSCRRSNLLPNGGFEFNTAGETPVLLGWLRSGPGFSSFSGLASHSVGNGGTPSGVLESAPSHVGVADDVAVSWSVAVRPGEAVVWSVRPLRDDQGNPHALAMWWDAAGTHLQSEYLMQGRSKGQGEAHAGVLVVPENARRLNIGLQNWKSTGSTRWDDALVIVVAHPDTPSNACVPVVAMQPLRSRDGRE